MVKIHFIGGEDLVVDVADPDGLARSIADPDAVIEVGHDGKRVFLAARAIAALVIMS
jgi:hypothetical protein